MGSFGRRLTATAILVGWLATPLAACAAAFLVSNADDQMAFCQGSADGKSFQDAMDCCPKSDSQQPAGLSRIEPLHQISALALQPPHPAAESTRHISRVVVSAPVLPVDTGPPDCISFSVLLI